MAELNIETVIKSGVEKALNEPIMDGKSITEWAAIGMKAPRWISADKRPPKQGRYLVLGLTRITPDHYDEANGFWEIQPAFWFEKSGWDRKVKFWQMLPEPPEEVSGE
jgi:hypothetical protein